METNKGIKYLVTNEQDISWGLVVNTVGYQHIKPNSPYPSTNHPVRYFFPTTKGRILEEYQLIYISAGQGSFISSNKKSTDIKEGNFIILFPGEWHNYKPDKEIGWYEHWIGFTGINMEKRIESGFFNPKKPIFNVGVNDDIIRLYKLAVDIAQKQGTGFQQMLAGIVNLLLGYAYSEDKQMSFEDMKVTNQIAKAKILMQDNFQNGISPREVAEKVNMSYSWFRRIFKEYTGFAPVQYIQELRIQKSKELLTNTMLQCKEIAFEVGFESPYYFSLAFRKKTGTTPVKYREITQGRNF